MESSGSTRNVATHFPNMAVWTVRAGEPRKAQRRKFPEARVACGNELSDARAGYRAMSSRATDMTVIRREGSTVTASGACEPPSLERGAAIHSQARRLPLPLMRQGAGRLEVDHIVPVQFGGAWWGPGRLQSLCRACHFRKSRAEAVKPNPERDAWRAFLKQPIDTSSHLGPGVKGEPHSFHWTPGQDGPGSMKMGL